MAGVLAGVHSRKKTKSPKWWPLAWPDCWPVEPPRIDPLRARGFGRGWRGFRGGLRDGVGRPASQGVRYLTLTYERPVGVNRPTDLAWNVQRSTDVTNPAGWSGIGLAAEQVTPQPGTGLEKVEVRSQTPINTAGVGKEFLRLSLEKF